MNRAATNLAVESLVKVIESAPVGMYTESMYKIWLDYVNSVLDITHNHLENTAILETKIAVLRISIMNDVPYDLKIKYIRLNLCNLARSLIET